MEDLRENEADFVRAAWTECALQLVENHEVEWEDGLYWLNPWVGNLPADWVNPWHDGESYDKIVIGVKRNDYVLASLFNSSDDDLELWGDWSESVPSELIYVDDDNKTTLECFEVCLYRLGLGEIVYDFALEERGK